jgi:hypothetical protein
VKNFRQYANTEWVLYQGPYSQFPRRTAMKDEVESAEGKAFVEGVAATQKAADEAAAADAAARQHAGKGNKQHEQQQQQPKQQRRRRPGQGQKGK